MMTRNKMTRNKADLYTLITGCIFTIFLWVGTDPAIRFYEQYLAARPFITPIIKIVPAEDGLEPDILYKAVAQFPVTGTWTAYIELRNGARVAFCQGKGIGTYRPNGRDPVLWDWADWLGRPDCRPPKVTPFRACAFYQVQSERGVWDTTLPVCSNLYDPVAQKEIDE